jgi:hypothetical protein
MNNLLFSNKTAVLSHWILGFISSGILFLIIWKSKIIPLVQLLELINSDVVSFSITLAGFELASVTLLISLNDNKKLADMNKVGEDKTLYRLFFHSIIFLTITAVAILVCITVFKTMVPEFAWVKTVFEYLALFTLWQGMVFFLSAMRMFILIFR